MPDWYEESLKNLNDRQIENYITGRKIKKNVFEHKNISIINNQSSAYLQYEFRYMFFQHKFENKLTISYLTECLRQNGIVGKMPKKKKEIISLLMKL